jgi:hypothetical protein
MSDQVEDTERKPGEFEYPDEAGYPDGTGTLDEGTAGTPDPQDDEDDEGV